MTDVGVILVGRFEVLPLVKAWASIFAVVGLLMATAVLAQAGIGMNSLLPSLITAIGISITGIVAIRLSQWLTHGVRQNLAIFIAAALSAGG